MLASSRSISRSASSRSSLAAFSRCSDSARIFSTSSSACWLAERHSSAPTRSKTVRISFGISRTAMALSFRLSRHSRMTGEICDREPPPRHSRTCSLVGLSMPSDTSFSAASMMRCRISGLIVMPGYLLVYVLYVCIIHKIHTYNIVNSFANPKNNASAAY